MAGTGDNPLDFPPFPDATAGRYFVGRERQLSQFDQSLRGLRAQVPTHLYVAGSHGTGKTSFLDKLKQRAREDGYAAVMPDLGDTTAARAHLDTVMRAMVAGVEAAREARSFTDRLVEDWELGSGSKRFSYPKTEGTSALSNAMAGDLRTLERLMEEADVPGAVICIDEGQRIDGGALSALKNAFRRRSRFLIVLALRLTDVTRGPVDDGKLLLIEKAGGSEGDIGAARFFGTGIAMGPFDTQHEAEECVRLRLEGNVIQFEPEVITALCRIEGHIPHRMMELARRLWHSAAEKDVRLVGRRLLDAVFQEAYDEEMREAIELLTTVGGQARKALGALVARNGEATHLEIARHLHPEAAETLMDPLAEAVHGELDRVVEAYPSLLSRRSDVFKIDPPHRVYALELALSTE